jgi:hypothetical protein
LCPRINVAAGVGQAVAIRRGLAQGGAGNHKLAPDEPKYSKLRFGFRGFRLLAFSQGDLPLTYKIQRPRSK